jgi:3-oxoacyl-[acyl-carrier-protein] synthase III
VEARILGLAHHLPEHKETNADLQRENPGWNMAALAEKSGILERRISAPGETASDLAYQAACNLLAQERVPRDTIDYLLFCTQEPDQFLPPAACVLQDRLHLGRHVGAFDFNLGCSGYIYGLQLAKSLIVSGQARNVLLLTGDTYSKFIHPQDRSVRPLFGDGAAATLVGASEAPGLGDFVVGTNGAGAPQLCVPTGGFREPRTPESAQPVVDDGGCVRSRDNLYMDGPGLFTFAITTVPRCVQALLAKAGRSIADYDHVVFHQANKFMLDSLATRLKIPVERMAACYVTVGNTVSSSVPIALEARVAEGLVRTGDRILLAGFGVGFSWGACDLVW